MLVVGHILHNDVPVVHTPATLNMAKSRTRLINFGKKVIYFYQSIKFFHCNSFNNCPVFRIAKAHFRWRHRRILWPWSCNP